MAQSEYYLMHHGVKGMKWGVRRTPEQLGYKRAQKGGVDERYVNKAVRQAYTLDRKPNKSARQSKRQMRIEEELETYVNTNRNSAKDAALSKAIAREQNRKPSAIQAKLSDPDFQRKAATAAKIALVIGAAYATHKVINDPKVLAVGKDAITKVAAKSGAVKASTLKNVMNSTEFKVAKAAIANSGAVKDAAKTVAGGAGKVLKKIGSEETRNVVTGIGAMAGTTAILRSQIKDFRENKPDGDRFDRAVKRTQQLSEIGENVNTLARGLKGASSSSSSSSNSNSSTSNNKSENVSVFTDSHTGAPIRANKKLSKEDKNTIKQYRASHPNMTLREALDELGWLDKDEAKHSAIRTGWYFNSSAKNYYIF